MVWAVVPELWGGLAVFSGAAALFAGMSGATAQSLVDEAVAADTRPADTELPRRRKRAHGSPNAGNETIRETAAPLRGTGRAFLQNICGFACVGSGKMFG